MKFLSKYLFHCSTKLLKEIAVYMRKYQFAGEIFSSIAKNFSGLIYSSAFEILVYNHSIFENIWWVKCLCESEQNRYE